MKYKINDRFIRNNKPIEHFHWWSDPDPKIIKIIDYANMEKGNSINGYRVQDIFTGKKADCSYEYLDYYYNKDERKEKLQKINESQ